MYCGMYILFVNMKLAGSATMNLVLHPNNKQNSLAVLGSGMISAIHAIFRQNSKK